MVSPGPIGTRSSSGSGRQGLRDDGLCIMASTNRIPARRRIGSSHTTFIYDGGILMAIGIVIGLVTAISTAVTALATIVIAKQRSAPELIAHITPQDHGSPFRVTISIYPGERNFHVHKISARNAFIDKGNWSVSPSGKQHLEESDHGLTRRSVSADIDVPSARFPGKVEPVYLLLKHKNSRCAARISLHTRFMCLPIRYSVRVNPNIDTAYMKFKI